MKKIVGFVLMLCVVLSFTSCNKTKSYTERLEAEKDAIERLMDSEGIVVLDEYPADGVFKENEFVKLENDVEFVKLENDVYLNVIDSGNGDRISYGERKNVICRFEARIFMSDTLTINGFGSEYLPVTMTVIPYYNEYYGIQASAVQDGSASSGLEAYVSEGLASGFYHVGDSATVKLIVPFKVSSQMLRQMYEPVYFTRVRYIFEK